MDSNIDQFVISYLTSTRINWSKQFCYLPNDVINIGRNTSPKITDKSRKPWVDSAACIVVAKIVLVLEKIGYSIPVPKDPIYVGWDTRPMS